MCRFLLILSKSDISTKEMKEYFWFKDHSIFKQCYKMPLTPKSENCRDHHLNLDGFGFGFFFNNDPKIYTNTNLSWNDHNLMQLLELIKTKLLLVHIRSISPLIKDIIVDKGAVQPPVHIYNCHPFEFDKYLFCHNGYIESFFDGINRKKIINNIDDNLIVRIKGSTDSEYFFYLILSFIKKSNSIIKGIKKTICFLNLLSKNKVLSLNFILTTPDKSYILRYYNHIEENPPSIYYFTDNDNFFISSEPIYKCNEWILFKRDCLMEIDNKTKKFNLYSISLQ